MDEVLRLRILRAAEVLRSYGASEVFLFGSAADERHGDPHDIDMAVRGLSDEKFLEAYAKAADCLDRELDLIDLDEDNPIIRLIKKRGELRRVG